MFIYPFWTVSNKPNENNALKPIPTVFIDHALPKIDREIEHVLIGVENRSVFLHETRSESRFRFWTPKIGAGFRPRVSSA